MGGCEPRPRRRAGAAVGAEDRLTARADGSAADQRAGERGSRKPRRPGIRRSDAEYYQELHDTSTDYQTNNWLIEELPALLAIDAPSILEVGCGNGLFLARAAEHWEDVWGVDWVRSPVLERVLADHPSIHFDQRNALDYEPERRFGLAASADFLEHLPTSALPTVLRRLHACADVSYHVIACYDDGHSHLTVLRERAWLALFSDACPGAGYRVVRKRYRRRGRRRPVVVISNFPRSR